MRTTYLTLTIIMLFCFTKIWSQNKISGTVVSEETEATISEVSIYNANGGLLATTDAQGYFEFRTSKDLVELVFYADAYRIKEIEIKTSNAEGLIIKLASFNESLNEIEVLARKRKVFEIRRLQDVEGTAIYAGKKTEVILIDQSTANLATNNARQIYSQVAGLNIYENDDAGLQLNIGGRGLDPNRTSNFNTRQNAYDISADVLGYPESYYTPASEGLQEIQIIRGAASLQYGTQFGGLVNFVTKEPVNKPFELITRNTTGSFGLFTNFTSISGTKNKVGYYGYFNYKRGDGFRLNSEFDSKNSFFHLDYAPNDKNKLSLELTYMDYLAQQAGGLTDRMFEEDPFQSNRERNWFQVNWFLYNLMWEHQFSENTNFSFNFFGLDALRDALGFRTNRVNQIDPDNERDLIKGTFENYGFETRLVSDYTISDAKSTFLVGAKYYNSNNTNRQGPGSDGREADFEFYLEEFPNYPNQSDSSFPNLNVALFGENIFYVNDKFTLTPGIRFEYIKTERDEIIKDIVTDGAGNVINENLRDEQETKERTFVLFGLGLNYQLSEPLEIYGNISENYRSVTFSDISTANPAFEISPDITDENGFSFDVGLRGNIDNKVSLDANVFGLYYRDRINIYTRADGKAERDNIGDARILGVESLFEFNLNKLFFDFQNTTLSFFINSSFITSEYTSSEKNGVVGNEVEFIPNTNIKTGIKLGYKDFLTSVQYAYLSSQFSDATNAVDGDISGVTGQIPAYGVLDISASYRYKFLKLEMGVNNLLDEVYFTRRATGYPGPGIIPSAPQNWYLGLELKI